MRFCTQCLLTLLCVLLSNARKILNDRDDIEGKIVGGKPVSLKRFPSVALFFNMEALCAGTILNSWSILTAAHCLDNNKDTDNMLIEVGSRYLYDFDAQQYEVNSFVTHENYNISSLFACDIALIFVKTPIQFSNTVKKGILINNKSWMKPHEKHFKATGWGWTKYGGPVSEDGLRMAELEYVPAEECGTMHQIKITPDMFCLYGNGTKDTCRGDSGGGVIWHDMVVGITSHGDGCAKKYKPSVYVNVLHFRNWIERNIIEYYIQYCDSKKSEE